MRRKIKGPEGLTTSLWGVLGHDPPPSMGGRCWGGRDPPQLLPPSAIRTPKFLVDLLSFEKQTKLFILSKKKCDWLGSKNKINHVFVTHIHLDHSGGAWKFAENGAKIYVHPKGAPHLENPEKLINSASKIYGEKMDMLWGQVKSIDKSKIKSVKNREIINVGNLKIESLTKYSDI